MTSCSQTSPAFCLKLQGQMTFEHREALEGVIIDAMRRHQSLEADLSEVHEIDLYGVHLLGLLQSVGQIVAISPEVEEAAQRLLRSSRRGALGMAAREGVSVHH